MKHLMRKYDETLYQSGLLDFYFKGLNMGILDIETTGLNPSRNKFILGGLYNCGEKTMHQFLAESRKEEPAALAAYLEELSKVDLVVTYNGKHFDMPFLEKRRAAFANTLAYASHADPTAASAPAAESLSHDLAHAKLPYNLDLYLVVQGHSPIRKFVPNLKQKTVEDYMGLWQNREDEISGAESVTLYNTYEKTKDPQLEHKILLHNSDDVLQLTRLLRVVSKCDFHKAMFHLGFPAGPLIVKNIRLDHKELLVTGLQQGTSLDYRSFAWEDAPVETHFESKTGSFTLRLPLLQDSGMRIADLDALGMDEKDFRQYPTYSSGFLALETPDGKNYMEINHFIKAFIHIFMNSL
ncbi:MAG: ribonuclease H-like domain-containing protein [Bacillota bacterium]|nr:ribonuclease H-like domain-containing protein [Bacillota bacterium]